MPVITAPLPRDAGRGARDDEKDVSFIQREVPGTCRWRASGFRVSRILGFRVFRVERFRV